MRGDDIPLCDTVFMRHRSGRRFQLCWRESGWSRICTVRSVHGKDSEIESGENSIGLQQTSQTVKEAGERQHFGCSQSGCALRNRKRLFTLRIWHRCINYDQIASRGRRCRTLEFWGLGIRTCITSLRAFPTTLLSLYGTQF